jgi:hypothetical protein
MPTDERGRPPRDRATWSAGTTGRHAGAADAKAASAQARVHAMLQSLADERLQARLHAASHAAGRAWTQSRTGIIVQQYRDSDFHDRTKRAVTVRFRIPLATDPPPAPRRLVLITVWAGALGLIGVVTAMPVLISLFRPEGGWYRPLMILIGLIGVGATAGALASTHRRRAPWIGLTIGTVALLLALAVNLLT